jgi:hypothetical protein
MFLQPSKDLNFIRTTGVPDPDERPWRMDIFEGQMIEFGCCIGGISPDIMPTISIFCWNLYFLDKLLHFMIFLKNLV